MKKISRLFGLAAMAAGLALMAGPAHAGFLVNPYAVPGFDPGLPLGPAGDVTEIQFTGWTNFSAMAGPVNVNGVYTANSITDGGATYTPLGMNFAVPGVMGWEVTFKIDPANPFTGVMTPVGGGNTNITANPGGIMNIYIDSFGPASTTGGLFHDPTTGLGYDDGILVAIITATGGGGVYHTASQDGSLDLSYSILWQLPGLFTPPVGGAHTDENIHAKFTIVPGTPGGPPATFPPDYNFSSDGSIVLTVIPEPATVLLLGAGLVGLGLWGRKRIAKG